MLSEYQSMLMVMLSDLNDFSVRPVSFSFATASTRVPNTAQSQFRTRRALRSCLVAFLPPSATRQTAGESPKPANHFLRIGAIWELSSTRECGSSKSAAQVAIETYTNRSLGCGLLIRSKLCIQKVINLPVSRLVACLFDCHLEWKVLPSHVSTYG